MSNPSPEGPPLGCLGVPALSPRGRTDVRSKHPFVIFSIPGLGIFENGHTVLPSPLFESLAGLSLALPWNRM